MSLTTEIKKTKRGLSFELSPSQDVATHSTITHQINSSKFWPIKGGICHAFRHLGFQIKIMLFISLFIFL